MLLMLAIMGLVFLELRNPGNWRLLGASSDDNQDVPETVTAARSTRAGMSRSTGFSRNSCRESA